MKHNFRQILSADNAFNRLISGLAITSLHRKKLPQLLPDRLLTARRCSSECDRGRW